jgi:tetratricopeptide (TPR) repeat protein
MRGIRMDKAFLSHNGADKEFVERVASKLERSKVIFDKFVFYEGDDFRESIHKGLKQSSLFVLFASKESLNAPWVKYELDEAETMLIEGQLKKILIFLVGRDVKHSDLPKWCQKGMIIQASNASVTARLIEEKLLKINTSYQDVYVGRGTDRDKYSEHLFKSKKASQVLVFYGLQGIGRRTFAKDILENIYNLRLGPIFEIDSTESLVNLYIKILDDVIDVLSQKDLANHIEAFEKVNLDQQTDEIVRLFMEYSDYKLAPCIVDNGGLLNEYGQYRKEYKVLMEKINTVKNLFLVILQTRNPSYTGEEQFFFVTYIGPLSIDGMNSLLSTYLRNMQIDYNREEVIEFTKYLDGYPPAAQFVRNTIDKYGMDVALADKTLLSDFKVHSFTQYLKKMIEENKVKINILRTCEALPPLNLKILNMLNNDNEFLNYIKSLMDQSIIVFDKQNNKYTLSAPLKEAVRRTWGTLDKESFKNISMKLKEVYWNENNLPENSILELLIFCLLRSESVGVLEEFKGIILPSTILKAAKSAYGNREWPIAIDLCQKVLNLNSDLIEARVILFKSLVRENENTDEVLKELKDRNYRGYNALKGFRDLKKKKYPEAIKSYTLALASGDESLAVYREIAECYYWMSDYENAKNHINKVLKRNTRPNPFVLDLAAKIAIENQEFEIAIEHISALELVDRPENVSHRKALLYSKQGDYNKAIQFAEEACKRQPPLPETFLNKAHVLIMLERYTEAQEVLDDIKTRFTTQIRTSFYLELRCKLSIENSNWEEAEIYLKLLSNKNSDYSKVLKFKIIELKLSDKKVSLVEKNELTKELQKLKSQGIAELIDNESSIKDFVSI